MDRLPWGEVGRQIPPGDAGSVDAEDAASMIRRRSRSGGRPNVQALPSSFGPPCCQSWFQQFPPGIGQVTWVRPLLTWGMFQQY
jgi:hypothetical protein